MYTMLIVDDEKFAAEGVAQCADWAALDIGRIHIAGSAGQAREVFRGHQIDILICDIEMPDENGLGLVEWVRSHSPQTEAVFLTCHSEFAYAKQAIQLGSFDYLLKPVDGEELVRVVEKMLDAIRAKRQHFRYNEMYHKYYALWQKQQPVLAERFWSDFLSRRILSFGDFLERSLQDAEMPLTPADRVLPVLISMEEWEKPLDDRNTEIMEYAVRKAAEELFLDGKPGHVATDKSGVVFVMLYDVGSQGGISPEACAETGRSFIAACRDYFYCRVSCYVGTAVPLQELAELCEGLKAMERTNTTSPQSVLRYEGRRPEAAPDGGGTVKLNASEWTALLLNGNRDRLAELIRAAMAQQEAAGGVKPGQIEALRHDLLQVIYHALHVKGMDVNQIPNFPLWASAQVRNLMQLKNWMINLVSAVIEATHARKESNGIVEEALAYIRANVEEDISREDIAAHVGLNSAYLSRLFKKETGTNLVDRLIEAKMLRARELLDGTEMNVSAVAQQVGYANFSHFTRTFKKQFGMNPQEYRSGK